jgi:hypothetical protein
VAQSVPSGRQGAACRFWGTPPIRESLIKIVEGEKTIQRHTKLPFVTNLMAAMIAAIAGDTFADVNQTKGNVLNALRLTG